MALSCTDFGGTEIAAVEVDATRERLGTLVRAIAQQSPHAGHWRLMLPSGTVLEDRQDTSTLAELLET